MVKDCDVYDQNLKGVIFIGNVKIRVNKIIFERGIVIGVEMIKNLRKRDR